MTFAATPRLAERAVDDLLVIAAQSGDRRAMAMLVRRWNGRLVSHAWRLIGDRALAEEAAQAAWLDIVRGLRGLRDERAFPAWAYRICTRCCGAGIAQAAERRLTDSAAPSDPAADAADVEACIDNAALRRAVATLGPGQRAAVALHYFEGLSIAETAVALGIPAGTAKTRLMHARARLRAILEGPDHD